MSVNAGQVRAGAAAALHLCGLGQGRAGRQQSCHSRAQAWARLPQRQPQRRGKLHRVQHLAPRLPTPLLASLLVHPLPPAAHHAHHRPQCRGQRFAVPDHLPRWGQGGAGQGTGWHMPESWRWRSMALRCFQATRPVGALRPPPCPQAPAQPWLPWPPPRPLLPAGFASIVSPGLQLQIGRFLATGADGGSLFLDVRPAPPALLAWAGCGPWLHGRRERSRRSAQLGIHARIPPHQAGAPCLTARLAIQPCKTGGGDKRHNRQLRGGERCHAGRPADREDLPPASARWARCPRYCCCTAHAMLHVYGRAPPSPGPGPAGIKQRSCGVCIFLLFSHRLCALDCLVSSSGRDDEDFRADFGLPALSEEDKESLRFLG